MKILIIGSGGREHALAWKIRQSPLVKQVFCAPGNGGIGQDVISVALATHDEIVAFCKKEAIDLVVVGPEIPLVEGLADILAEKNIPVFGPSAKAAQLEGSKGFTKDICRKYNIPTAGYKRFIDADPVATGIKRSFETKYGPSANALAYVKEKGAPIVIKADGLAAGKGVTVAMTEKEASDAVNEIMGGRYGNAGASVVIEDFLEGEEVSFFALTDGREAIEFGSAQDHKRAYDGDKGPNTGGMGTYSPAPIMSDALRRQVMDEIIHPTVRAMAKEGMPYKGVLFAGLMITKSGPKLIEYNVRFGDPETQSLMMRLDSDIVPALLACVHGDLDKVEIRFKSQAALCVVMAAKGYPGDYKKGSVIKGLDAAAGFANVKVFHAGTQLKDGNMTAIGGRALGVTVLADTIQAAQQLAYNAVDAIDWPEGFCRRDIGSKAIREMETL